VGGVAGGVSEESSIVTRFGGKLEIEDLKTVKGEDGEGNQS
jgi:DNA-directed RNA polymerase subunit beta'